MQISWNFPCIVSPIRGNKEKSILESKLIELEEQKTTAEGKAKLYETQIAALEEQKNSLTASLKSAMEQKVDIEPLKKHALMLRNKIHQIQTTDSGRKI